MKIDFTDAASGDLQSIRDYTLHNWGVAQEEKYLEELWRIFEEIAADSSRWRFRNDLFPGCQIASQGKPVILFKIEGDVVQVVRILHSGMDFRRHFPE